MRLMRSLMGLVVLRWAMVAMARRPLLIAPRPPAAARRPAAPPTKVDRPGAVATAGICLRDCSPKLLLLLILQAPAARALQRSGRR